MKGGEGRRRKCQNTSFVEGSFPGAEVAHRISLLKKKGADGAKAKGKTLRRTAKKVREEVNWKN